MMGAGKSDAAREQVKSDIFRGGILFKNEKKIENPAVRAGFCL
jgi:hypothetical protein